MQEQSNLAAYQQMEEFLDQGGQRAFWIFSFAQVVGLFAGLFVGRVIGGMLPPALSGLLGTPLLFAGALLGIAATWKVKGQPLYARAWNSLSFMGRRLLRLGTPRISSSEIYDIPAETTVPLEWAEGGRPVFTFAGQDSSLTSGSNERAGRRRR